MPIETLRPNSDISSEGIGHNPSGLGPFYDKVNEAVADDSATRLYSLSGDGFWDEALFGLPDSSIGQGVINGVTLKFRGAVGDNDPSVLSYQGFIRTHDTNYYSDTYSGAAWTDRSKAWTTNPNTGVIWTWTEINALQCGVSLLTSIEAFEGNITQMYIEVDYTLSGYQMMV